MKNCIRSVFPIYDALFQYFNEDASDKITAIETVKSVKGLMNLLLRRKEDASSELERVLNETSNNLNPIEKYDVMIKIVDRFYGQCIEYLTKWLKNTDNLEHLCWMLLESPAKWQDVDRTSRIFIQSGHSNDDEHHNLYIVFGYLKDYVTEEVCTNWNKKNIFVADRWAEFFKAMDGKLMYDALAHIVAYRLCIPGVNAPVERLFSLSNHTWTDEKSRLSVKELKAILMIQCNIRMNCIEFYQSIKNMPNILRKNVSKKKCSLEENNVLSKRKMLYRRK